MGAMQRTWRPTGKRRDAVRPPSGKPRAVSAAVDLCVANDRECTGREQAAQIAIALLADAAELWLASARALFRH
jgi:hypothetical protein